VVEQIVYPGDIITLLGPAEELGEDLFCGHPLDNRASLAALTACLQAIREIPLSMDLIAVATTQEEESTLGALNAAYSMRPSIAIAIDVTYGRAPGVADHESFALGDGPAIGWGSNIHPMIFNALKEIGGRDGRPLQVEVMPGSSGTDAETMQTAAEGVPTGLISIPTRYLHSPVETASIADIQATADLLTRFLTTLDMELLSKLTEVHSYD
jgi:endoglucanase